MRLDSLDRLAPGVPVHVIAWRFTDDGSDLWTRRINAFKNQEKGSLKGAARVLYNAIPLLIKHMNWSPTDTALTAVLSSDDTNCVPTKPLPRLGSALASKIGVQWMPDILSKKPHRKLHSVGPRDERDAEADKAEYRCAPITGVQRVLLLDDMITSGKTANNIRNAILEANRRMYVYPLALGKTEKKKFAADHGRTLTNEHVPASWAQLWDAE